jgi:hypothetical protein
MQVSFTKQLNQGGSRGQSISAVSSITMEFSKEDKRKERERLNFDMYMNLAARADGVLLILL